MKKIIVFSSILLLTGCKNFYVWDESLDPFMEAKGWYIVPHFDIERSNIMRNDILIYGRNSSCETFNCPLMYFGPPNTRKVVLEQFYNDIEEAGEERRSSYFENINIDDADTESQ